jgi:hypothetical protein
VLELSIQIGLAGEQAADILTREAAAEPAPLHLGHVTDRSQRQS